MCQAWRILFYHQESGCTQYFQDFCSLVNWKCIQFLVVQTNRIHPSLLGMNTIMKLHSFPAGLINPVFNILSILVFSIQRGLGPGPKWWAKFIDQHLPASSSIRLFVILKWPKESFQKTRNRSSNWGVVPVCLELGVYSDLFAPVTRLQFLIFNLRCMVSFDLCPRVLSLLVVFNIHFSCGFDLSTLSSTISHYSTFFIQQYTSTCGVQQVVSKT